MASSSRSRRAEYREGRAFIDADEIPKLVKGIDALLDVSSNPTSFGNFEVRYSTKGDLQITGFNSCDRGNALACHGDPQDRDDGEGMVWWFDGPNGAQRRFAADSEILNPPTIEQLRAMLSAAEDVAP